MITTGSCITTCDSLSMRWSIRESLLAYVRSRGLLSCSPPHLWQNGTFVFVSQIHRIENDRTIADFDGEIQMHAHGGAMKILLQQPRLEWFHDSGVGTLSFESPTLGRFPIAKLTLAQTGQGLDGSVSGQDVTLEAKLTNAGAMLFGGFYSGGDPLDDMVLSGFRPPHTTERVADLAYGKI